MQYCRATLALLVSPRSLHSQHPVHSNHGMSYPLQVHPTRNRSRYLIVCIQRNINHIVDSECNSLVFRRMCRASSNFSCDQMPRFCDGLDSSCANGSLYDTLYYFSSLSRSFWNIPCKSFLYYLCPFEKYPRASSSVLSNDASASETNHSAASWVSKCERVVEKVRTLG
jgi:hypothetical protein